MSDEFNEHATRDYDMMWVRWVVPVMRLAFVLIAAGMISVWLYIFFISLSPP